MRGIGARTLADAVEYTTGVRVESNCQNCDFSQIRLLWLEGPYTQILMGGQPVGSSLAQVYGIEQIPSRMIDRIEIVKGGGSALYGPESVGGVVNIISREPAKRGGLFESRVNSLGRHLFVGELRNAGPLRCVLNRDGRDIALRIDIEQRVLVQVARFRDRDIAELDMESVCFSEVPDLHGANPRSKNAL